MSQNKKRTHFRNRSFLEIAIVAVIVVFLILWYVIPGNYAFLIAYVVATNIVTFSYYAVDKSLAQAGTQRIPESYLLFLTFIGGSIGAIVAINFFGTKAANFPIRPNLLEYSLPN